MFLALQRSFLLTYLALGRTFLAEAVVYYGKILRSAKRSRFDSGLPKRIIWYAFWQP